MIYFPRPVYFGAGQSSQENIPNLKQEKHQTLANLNNQNTNSFKGSRLGLYEIADRIILEQTRALNTTTDTVNKRLIYDKVSKLRESNKAAITAEQNRRINLELAHRGQLTIHEIINQAQNEVLGDRIDLLVKQEVINDHYNSRIRSMLRHQKEQRERMKNFFIDLKNRPLPPRRASWPVRTAKKIVSNPVVFSLLLGLGLGAFLRGPQTLGRNAMASSYSQWRNPVEAGSSLPIHNAIDGRMEEEPLPFAKQPFEELIPQAVLSPENRLFEKTNGKNRRKWFARDLPQLLKWVEHPASACDSKTLNRRILQALQKEHDTLAFFRSLPEDSLKADKVNAEKYKKILQDIMGYFQEDSDHFLDHWLKRLRR
jgi:hypothetical protein